MLLGIPFAVLIAALFTVRMEIGSLIIISIGILIMSIVAFRILSVRLIIDETENGIKIDVKYFGKQKKVLFKWSDIDSVKIKRISPIRDFGGWGIRYTIKTTGFIFSGNRVVFIKTRYGRSFAFTVVRTIEFYTMMTQKHGLRVAIENTSLI